MSTPRLFRRRLIPNEIVLLKDDRILYANEQEILTEWTVLKPRADFDSGRSLYLLDYGCKLSRMSKDSRPLPFFYCDIIHTDYDADSNSYIFLDLLLDLLVYEDGNMKLLDLAELGEAKAKNLLDESQELKALELLKKLIAAVRNGSFGLWADKLMKYGL